MSPQALSELYSVPLNGATYALDMIKGKLFCYIHLLQPPHYTKFNSNFENLFSERGCKIPSEKQQLNTCLTFE